MAARSALVNFTSLATRTRIPPQSLRAPILFSAARISAVYQHQRSSFHSNTFLCIDVTPSQPTAPKTPESIAQTPPSTPPPDSTSDDGRHAAYLGEADSDDGFETWKDTHGKDPESLDAGNSAFLGEADGDDGFESRKDIDGEKLEAIDATQSAFLGEADSDDGFEADKNLNPEKYEHKIEDASVSGEHGQPGEGDGDVEK